MDRYIEKEGKRLRYGVTTGTCATAAAKACALYLDKGKAVDQVIVHTPKGWDVELEVIFDELAKEHVSCHVIKDAGDDPDVTDGITIYATVTISHVPGIHIEGGLGVGRVTKKGLAMPVGEAAINPVPRQMIKDACQDFLGKNIGYEVLIWTPEGQERAKKTFNPKLGILGDISVLGTSGIVEPMSEDALKETMRIELSMKKALGVRELIYVFGNYGRDFCQEHHINKINKGQIPQEDRLQKISNFVEFAFRTAADMGFEEVLFVGHIGKMSKVAYGMKNTHSRYGDHRMESLEKSYRKTILGEPCIESVSIDRDKLELDQSHPIGDTEDIEKISRKILAFNTTEEAVEYFMEITYGKVVLQRLLDEALEHVREFSGHRLKVEGILFSSQQGLLAKSRGANAWMEETKL